MLIKCPECTELKSIAEVDADYICSRCNGKGFVNGSKKLILEINLDRVDDRYEDKSYSIIDQICSDMVVQMSYNGRESGTITDHTLKTGFHNEKEDVLAYFRVVETPEG